MIGTKRSQDGRSGAIIGRWILGACIAVLVVAAGGDSLPAQERSPDEGSKVEIRALVDLYMQSIDAADPKMGATVWLTTPDVSFINPVGHERGWDEIASELYVKLMGGTFSKRHLTSTSDLAIHVYGDAAVVEFDWDFVATLRSDGKTPVHTTGRESQMYARLPGVGWRLVHVHYSGPPVAPPKNGRF